MSEAPAQEVHDRGPTFVPVTPRGRNGGKEGRKEGGEGSPEGGPMRPRGRARTRGRMVAAADAVTHGVRLRGVSGGREKTPEEAAAPDIHESDAGLRNMWRDGPAPAADVWAYTRSGAWLRGARNPLLEWAGKAWGVFALLVTLVLGSAIWCTHRFHRFFVAAIIIGVLVVSWPFSGGVS